MIEFTLNGETVRTDDDPSTPLLWVVRDTFKLKRFEIWLRCRSMRRVHDAY